MKQTLPRRPEPRPRNSTNSPLRLRPSPCPWQFDPIQRPRRRPRPPNQTIERDASAHAQTARNTMPHQHLWGAATGRRPVQTEHRRRKRTTQLVLLPRFEHHIDPERQPTRRCDFNGMQADANLSDPIPATPNRPTGNQHNCSSWNARKRQSRAPCRCPATTKNGKKRDQKNQPRPVHSQGLKPQPMRQPRQYHR